jgi:hypothetical protein
MLRQGLPHPQDAKVDAPRAISSDPKEASVVPTGLRRANASTDGGENRDMRRRQKLLQNMNAGSEPPQQNSKLAPIHNSEFVGDDSDEAIDLQNGFLDHDTSTSEIEAVSVVLKDPFLRWQLMLTPHSPHQFAATDGMRHDNLHRHAAQFVAATDDAMSSMKRHLNQANLLHQLRSPCRLDKTAERAHSAVDPVELEFNLAAASRLLHTCRWPLLFDKSRMLLEQSIVWQPRGTSRTPPHTGPH